MRTTATALLALAALIAAIMAQPDGNAQQGLSMGVDADPTGNTPTSLGTIESCVSVQKGDSFPVDVFITDVSDLLAWEAYFSYDGSIVNVTDLDVKLFQAANANSDVFNASESLPSSGGLYRLGAIDLGQPPSPDSGSGVLTRLTLEAVGAGISPAILMTLDANNDGRPDLGTLLRDPQENLLGDTNGDQFFDGTVINAQIAVDRDCPPGTTGTAIPAASPIPASETAVASPVGTQTPSDATPATPAPRETATVSPGVASPTPNAPPSGDGDSDWNSPAFVAAIVAAGTVAVLVVGGLALLGVRRRRP